MNNNGTLGKATTLLAGDWLALAVFVMIGQIEHRLLAANGVVRLLQVTAELALPWTAVAVVMGAHRWRYGRKRSRFLARSLNAWLVAAPLALLLRAWLRGQATIPVLFIIVTLSFGGAFLLGWRALYDVWQRRGRDAMDNA